MKGDGQLDNAEPGTDVAARAGADVDQPCEYVVGDLKCQADRVAELRQRRELRSIDDRGDSAGAHRGADECTSFRPMDSLELLQRERPALALEIEQLATDHAAGPRRAHELH